MGQQCTARNLCVFSVRVIECFMNQRVVLATELMQRAKNCKMAADEAFNKTTNKSAAIKH